MKPSKRSILGKVPVGLTYVGSVDEMEAARKRYRDMMARFPRHVSYATNQRPSGATDMQQLVWDMEGKNR
ncbi:hypothetical protein D3C71_1169740 [compost metagenome]